MLNEQTNRWINQCILTLVMWALGLIWVTWFIWVTCTCSVICCLAHFRKSSATYCHPVLEVDCHSIEDFKTWCWKYKSDYFTSMLKPQMTSHCMWNKIQAPFFGLLNLTPSVCVLLFWSLLFVLSFSLFHLQPHLISFCSLNNTPAHSLET